MDDSSEPASADEAVAQFVEKMDAEGAPDLTGFLSRVDVRQQDEVAARCGRLLRLRQVLSFHRARGRKVTPRRLVGYELLREVGKGGMGTVYAAREESLDREIAIKVMHEDLATRKEYMERFRDEARSAASLDHPGIVKILRFGESDGSAYIAMELVRGPPISELIQQKRDQSTGSSEADVPSSLGATADIARVTSEVARALQCAHDRNIVHRDVKPQNILLDEQDRARVVDFGLARDLNRATMTQDGQWVGTASYMSPEQASARRDVKVDGRTDIYSLGVVLFEMLTLEVPFCGKDPKLVIDSILRDAPARVCGLNPDVPRDLETICLKSLERSPARRYQSAAEFADDLDRFRRHEAIKARPASWSLRLGRRLIRHRLATVAVASMIVALAIGIPWAINQERERALEPDLNEAEALVTAWEETGELPPETNMVARRVRKIAADPRNSSSRVRRVKARIHAMEDDAIRELLDDGREKQEQSRSSPKGTPFAEFRHESGIDFFRGHLLLRRASNLRPEDLELRRLARIEAGFPRLCVTSDPPGSEVYLRSYDFGGYRYGPCRSIGKTPIVDELVYPGFYRVIVQAPDGRFSEYTRWIAKRLHEYRIDARVGLNSEIAHDMVPISGGSYRGGSAGVRQHPTGTYEVDDFSIDRREVSNADYKQFIDDTGWPAPRFWVPHARDDSPFREAYDAKYPTVPDYWRDGYDPDTWDEHPVVGINWLDAVAFAEWAGKRLPTILEWERAARGAEGRTFPWITTGSGDSLNRCVLLGSDLELDTVGNFDWFPLYLAQSRPTDFVNADRTPEGVLHLLGNVREFVDGVPLGNFDNEPHPVVTQRLVAGGDWKTPKGRANIQRFAHFEAQQWYLECHLGFRCARSRVIDIP